MAPLLEHLGPLIGTWEVRVDLPGTEEMTGRMTIEPALGGAFLLESSEAPDPVPDGLCLIAASGEGAFTQHYFDSRGVVRVYEMGFDDGVWTLRRERADFTELPFKQRFEGALSEDGRRIDCCWERTGDDGEWMTDFTGTYTRLD